MLKHIVSRIQTAVELKQSVMDSQIPAKISELSVLAVKTIRNNNKIMFCGNGGSASDAQHMAAELVNRFYLNRKPMAAIALTADIAVISSVANDFSYDDIFSKQVQALGKPKDLLITLSTSGKSQNILNAVEIAKESEILTVGFSGQSPNPLDELADFSIAVPSADIPRIQEIHYMLLHILCELVEKEIYGSPK